MGSNLRGTHVGVAKQSLHSADIAAAPEQLVGKTMTTVMPAHRLAQAAQANSLPKRVQTDAIYPRSQQVIGRWQVSNNAHSLRIRHYPGHMRRTLSADSLANLPLQLLQHTGINKDAGTKPHMLRCHRDFPLAGQPIKSVDLHRPQLKRITHTEKVQVTTNPLPIALYCANAVVKFTNHCTNWLLQMWLARQAIHTHFNTFYLYSVNKFAKASSQTKALLQAPSRTKFHALPPR